MFHPYILIFAYSDALKAKNIRNPSSNNITLNAINIKRIHKVSQALLTNSWQPRLTIRMLITKVNPAEYRPLTMLSSIDKIIATAMKVVFNAIFEKILDLNMLPKSRYFHNFSHGFRPNRGYHSTLNIIIT
jgi:hypothetical protein